MRDNYIKENLKVCFLFLGNPHFLYQNRIGIEIPTTTKTWVTKRFVDKLLSVTPWAGAVAASYGPEYVSAEYLRLGHDLYQSPPTLDQYKR